MVQNLLETIPSLNSLSSEQDPIPLESTVKCTLKGFTIPLGSDQTRCCCSEHRIPAVVVVVVVVVVCVLCIYNEYHPAETPEYKKRPFWTQCVDLAGILIGSTQHSAKSSWNSAQPACGPLLARSLHFIKASLRKTRYFFRRQTKGLPRFC